AAPAYSECLGGGASDKALRETVFLPHRPLVLGDPGIAVLLFRVPFDVRTLETALQEQIVAERNREDLGIAPGGGERHRRSHEGTTHPLPLVLGEYGQRDQFHQRR